MLIKTPIWCIAQATRALDSKANRRSNSIHLFNSMMSELSEIKEDIKDTKAKLKKAEEDGDKDEVRELRALLTEQTAVWKNLIASQGKFQLLSLHIARSNPIPSTLMLPMMTDNA